MIKTRNCKWCGKEFPINIDKRTDGRIMGANRKYCCYQHSRIASWNNIKNWTKQNPDKVLEHRKKRYNPQQYKIDANIRRIKILEILGNKCQICNNNNPYHLQAHYIPTINGYGWRHSRHPAFYEKNKKDFILLCANHHQELTITGKIIVGGDVIYH